MDYKIISWNIRGMNSFNKINALKELVANHKCTICMVQETKIMKMNQWFVKQIWYDNSFDWVYPPSVESAGNSGGLLTIWDTTKLVKEDIILKVNNISTLFTSKINGFKVGCL